MAKILLIEDDTAIADIYKRQLEKAGFTVSVETDGTKGFASLQVNPPDLLLLDIMLPGMTGLEILKNFKKENPGSKMVTLLLTNLGQDDVIKTGFDLGAAGYLIKANYTPAQVVNEVKNALGSK